MVSSVVPKAAAKTLASYDEIAGKELARRQIATARQPLNDRAMVWPMATGGQTSASVSRPERQETLPWHEDAASPAKRKTSERARPTQSAEKERDRPPPSWKKVEPTWQEKMFQHYQ